MSSAAFPRGGLSDETTEKKDKKADRKKRKDREEDLLATRKPAKPRHAQHHANLIFGDKVVLPKS